MKKAILMGAIAFCAASANASASTGIEFWNSNLTWAGQGQCSAQFTFDSGFMDITRLEVAVTLQDRRGKAVGKEVIRLGAFGQSEANRYEQAFVESEQACDDSVRYVVTRATAVIDGKRVDLLKTHQLQARRFVPAVIKVP